MLKYRARMVLDQPLADADLLEHFQRSCRNGRRPRGVGAFGLRVHQCRMDTACGECGGRGQSGGSGAYDQHIRRFHL
jgi:hypothetical protein